MVAAVMWVYTRNGERIGEHTGRRVLACIGVRWDAEWEDSARKDTRSVAAKDSVDMARNVVSWSVRALIEAAE
jgi:hypothetical protein